MKIVQPSTLIATVVAVMVVAVRSMLGSHTLAQRVFSSAKCEHSTTGRKLSPGQRVLIVAHANTIRALVKAVDTA